MVKVLTNSYLFSFSPGNVSCVTWSIIHPWQSIAVPSVSIGYGYEHGQVQGGRGEGCIRLGKGKGVSWHVTAKT